MSGTTADDWADEYFARLGRSRARRARLARERAAYGDLPDGERAARAFASKTEQLARFLRGERTRKDASNGK